MAAPNKVVAVMDDGRKEVIRVDRKPRDWRSRVRVWQVHSQGPNMTWLGSNLPSGSKTFKLHCDECLKLGCSDAGSAVQKPIQHGGTPTNDYTTLLTGHRKHNSTLAQHHVNGCPCVGISRPSISRTQSRHQPSRIIPIEYLLERGANKELYGRFNLGTLGDPDIDKELQKEALDRLQELEDKGICEDPSLDNKGNFRFKIRQLPSNISFRLQKGRTTLGNTIFNVMFTNDIRWNNIRIWEQLDKTYLRPKMLIGRGTKKVILSRTDKNVYLFDPTDSLQVLDQKIQDSESKPLPDSHPLGKTLRPCSERNLRAAFTKTKDIGNKYGIELARDKENVVELEVHEMLDPDGNFTHLLLIRNQTKHTAFISCRFFPRFIGMSRTEADSGITDYEEIDDDLDKDNFQLSETHSPQVNPGETDWIFLQFTGRGEFECTQLVTIENNLSDDEIVHIERIEGIDPDSSSPKILRWQPKVDFIDFPASAKTSLVRKIMDCSGISGFGNWKHHSEVLQ